MRRNQSQKGKRRGSPFPGNDKGRKKRGDSATIRGILSVNSRAVGFIETEHGEDIRIESEHLNTALNRDEVEIEPLRERVRGQQTGRVVRILKRAKMKFVGTLEERGNRFVLVPDDFRMYAPIAIPRPPRDAQKGFKALAEVTEWKPGQEPLGTIERVIGKKGEHEVEIESIVLERGFESSFPPEVDRDAERVAAAEQARFSEEIKTRRDFRKHTLFTIDPENAKDFDDALSIEKLPNGRLEIGVHIADVSHYVQEGTVLDEEARERATSVYLVDRTIPMLPHILSNELCSLNPNVDRLAFSAVFEMDLSGHVYSRWFGKSVIHSKRRFTYHDAQELIDSSPLPLSKGETREGVKTTTPQSPPSKGGEEELREALQTLNAIAKKLRVEKMKKGAIDFEHDEVGFELDDAGHPVRVFKKERLEAHKLIEEFMLLANREVAEYFFKNAKHSSGKELPFIYRIHDMPDQEKIEALRVFVHALGHELPLGKNGRVSGKDLQALFKKISGHASESLIKTAAIRSMAKAIYSTGNIGHFGLAFEYYTHFTSPIRRYPDLMVHRLLFGFLQKHRFDTAKFGRLERMSEHATRQEIAAAEAERESIKLKQVEYMQDFIGKEFEGTISGVTEWGIYVEEKETRAEGMIKLRDLGDDYYNLDAGNYRVVGDRTKKTYSLGDTVRFCVMGADLERKTLDFKLV